MSAVHRADAWAGNQQEGWVAYGLREIVVERMLPDLMQVETTSICNLRCVFCPYDELTRDKENMDLKNFTKFLNEQCGHVKSVGLHHFGEPFLNRQLHQYISTCTELGIETTISTNANRISTEQAENVIKAGLNRLILSLDAVNAEDYERLRTGGRYDKMMASIERFLDAKQRLDGKTFVQVQFISTPENNTTWPAFEQLWKEQQGVDQVVLREEKTHAGQRIRHDAYKVRGEERLPCRYLWESLVVLADGRVVPCCKDFDGKEVLGNIFAGDTLSDIWNGPRMVELRQAHVEGEFSRLPLCASCTEWPGHGPMKPEQSRKAFIEFRDRKDQSRIKPVHYREFE